MATNFWYRVANTNTPTEGNRLHVRVNGRYLTIFRYKNKLSVIDSICHHAGGPLTLGPLQDIEDLSMTVVLCPWHKFMVSIEDGTKAYKSVEIKNGKPTVGEWKIGKVVQRPHRIVESSRGIFISLQDMMNTEECSSDKDANNDLCARDYEITCETTTPIDLTEEELRML